uniref:DUF4283 domain-containing protein n=1 Tax=Cannabis sativa TaxID=3483 RepID=A0A803PIH2_CANSA
MAKDIHVEMVDEEMNKVLQRDSQLEMEFLELFEDIMLEEVVSNKACVGKVICCKDMLVTIAKKILTGVSQRLGPWRMKKCDEGVLGFFFQDEDDCNIVLENRPWLVNGVALNLKPWPVEGDVRVADFEKVGSFIKADSKSKEELVRRGYIWAWIDVWLSQPIPVGFFLTADGKLESWIQFKAMEEKPAVMNSECTTGKGKEKLLQAGHTAAPGKPNSHVAKKMLVATATKMYSTDNHGTIDIGPLIAQSLEIPNNWVFQSQKPHLFLEPTPIGWPNHDPVAQQTFLKLCGPEYLNLHKAQQSLLSNPQNLSEMIFSNNRKRKSHTWFQPYNPNSPSQNFTSNADVVTEIGSTSEASSDVQKFVIGAGDKDDESSRRGSNKLSKRRNKRDSIKRSFGVKTRSRKKKGDANVNDSLTGTGNLDEILANCIETSSPGCGKVVDQAWGKVPATITDVQYQKKLITTKYELRKWHQDVFGFCDRQLMSLRSQLGRLQNEPITTSTVELEAQIQIEIMELEGRMDRIWRQKSRENWIREPELDTLFIDKVTDMENDLIYKIPENSEIKEIVLKLHPLKSPRPNGFSRVLNKKLNHTFICLIPKVLNADRVDLFRPISLCNFSYEIIFRILTDWLKEVMDSYSILLNGTLLAPFDPKRGLRQDDSIIFCHATAKNAENLMQCIQKYEKWSGQCVSEPKSGVVFSPNTSQRTRDDIKSIVGMNPIKATEKYLGNPFFFTAKKRDDYLFLKEKIMTILEGWKAKLLSQAGRKPLIGYVLQSIPNYFMSTTQVPSTLCGQLDRLLARFWWVGNADKRHYCALKCWDKICQPKRCGGLGFRRLKDMNMALLSKLSWMVLQGQDKVWVKLLLDKYCSKVDVWQIEKHGTDSRCWKSLLEARSICVKGVNILIADGSSDIWDRPWIPCRNSEEIKDRFQFIHNQALWKVKDLFLDGTREWNAALIKECFEEDITSDILKIRLLQESPDIIFWNAAKSDKQCSMDAVYFDCLHRMDEFLKHKAWFNQEDPPAACFATIHQQDLLADFWISVGFSHVKDILEGELCRIACALHLALKKKITKVRIETNSKTVS